VSRAPGLVDVPFDGVAGMYVELLNGAAARKVVHPRQQKGPRPVSVPVPSVDAAGSAPRVSRGRRTAAG
jgi:hypothetical protein